MSDTTPITFESLGLPPAILKALNEKGYTEPTPIQAQAIPAVLNGDDLMAAAQTGTGKTAGFTLPLLMRLTEGTPAKANHARVLILTPTRELAAQIQESVATYGKHTNLRSCVVFGGVKINPQMMKLRQGADILVATPGRLLDLYSQNAIKFSDLEVLVLDEADRMLDMGFIHDIRRILALLPEKRQSLLFSATFSDSIRKLARGFLNNPVEISVTPRNAAATSVKQWIHPVDKKRKAELLCNLIVDNNWSQALVFSRTKHGANKLVKQLEAFGINAAAIHGNKSQGARTKALAGFKNGSTRILVATDIAARGIDIDQLPQVVNFDLPNVPEDYVHRIGRTGRAGMEGQAVSLVSADEVKQLSDIERLIQKLLIREYVSGFEPDHEVPETSLRPPARPPRTKKPSAPRNSSSNRNSSGRGNSSGNGNEGNDNRPSSSRRRSSQNDRPSNSRSGQARSGQARSGQNRGNTAVEKNGNR